eukprot:TRINITY_DN2306_c0_g1_i2.p1 TRINITY_DN2306_c0_g1~~TRINITY_DN2306_c0_g1_i2.p1  ORF type:complete len:484 (-),score=113.65 TRINITY_DN2306_c0_g1_i2:107-1558(-)
MNPTEGEYLTDEGIKMVFERLDTNKDGFLDIKEIKICLNELYIDATQKEVEELIKIIVNEEDKNINDKPNNNPQKPKVKINFEQFNTFVKSRERKLMDIFNELDLNQDGVIHHQDLENYLIRAKFIDKFLLTPVEIKKMFKALDRNRNGEINFKEWRRFMLMYPSISPDYIIEHWKTTANLGINIGESYKLLKEKRGVVAWKVLVAGGVAGAISRTLTAPMDRLKVLLQAGGSLGKDNQKITGIRQGLTLIYKTEGLRAFWKGNGANVFKIMPESSIKFYVFEHLKRILPGDERNVTVAERFIAGSLAGFTSQLCIYPMEVAKTRLAVGNYNGIYDCLKSVYMKEGFTALFRGLIPSLTGIVPYSGIELTTYFTLKQIYLKKHPEITQPSVFVTLSLGATSSFIAQTCAYPLQLVRTKLQSQGAPGYPKIYNGMLDCLVGVYKANGFFGLFKGMAPNSLKTMPAISISYLVYEKMKIFLGMDI